MASQCLTHSRKLTDTSSKLLAIGTAPAAIPKVTDARFWRGASYPSSPCFSTEQRLRKLERSLESALPCACISQATAEQRAARFVAGSGPELSFPHPRAGLFSTFRCLSSPGSGPGLRKVHSLKCHSELALSWVTCSVCAASGGAATGGG